MRRLIPAQRPPRRRLSRHARPARESAASGAPDVLGIVESTVLGVLLFVRRFVNTFVQTAFRPARLGRVLGDDQAKRSVLGPYTFICLSGFYAVKLLRLALVLLFLVPIAMFKGCEQETTEDLQWPGMSQLLATPAVNELLLIGLPLIAASLGLAWLVWRVLNGGNQEHRAVFMQAACYCFGLELLLLLPACLLMSTWLYAGEDSRLRAVRPALDKGLPFLMPAVLVVLVLWPAFSIFRMFGGLSASTSGRTTRRRRAALAVAALVATLAMALFGVAMSYPAARSEFIAKYKPKSLLGIAPIDDDLVATPAATWRLALWNNTGQSMQFRSEGLVLHGAGGGKYAASITRMPFGARPVLLLEPQQRTWIEVTIDRALEPGSGAAARGDDPPRLCLQAVRRATGHARRPVCAWVGAPPPGPDDCRIGGRWTNCLLSP
jgi:hypothetical protein